MAEEIIKSSKINYIKYGSFLFLIIIIPIIFEFSIKEKSQRTQNIFLYVSLLAIPLFFILAYDYIFQGEQISNMKMFQIFLVIAFVAAIIVFSYNELMQYAGVATFFTYLFTILFVLGIIVGLAMLFYVTSNYLKSLDGSASFLIYLLFYIPCLLLDFVNYVIDEFKLTTKPIYILLALEAVIIAAYVYLPKLINYISKKEGIPLIQSSTFLDMEQEYSLPEEVLEKKDRVNYSISMWLYLNKYDDLATNEERTLFSLNNGMPKITHKESDENKYLTIYYTNFGEKMSSSLELATQKWNNLVFNYHSGHVDLFMNGVLEQTFSFSEQNLPNYFDLQNKLLVGDERGIDGAICNVRYYRQTLSKRKIATFYNLLKNKNPPTFNM